MLDPAVMTPSSPDPPACPPADPAAILIVDDHPLFRHALQHLVESTGEFRVVGAYGSVEDLLAAPPPTVAPVLALLDLFLGDGDGLRLIQELERRYEGIRAVVITAFREDWNLERASRAGATAFLDKTADPPVILRTLRDALRGVTNFPRGRAIPIEPRAAEPGGVPETRLFQLSPRERDVARLLAAGCSNQQIARTLFIAPGTAKLHVGRIYEKLGVHDRARAIVFLMAHKALL